MRAKFFREHGIFSAASNCRHSIAKLIRELHSQVPQPANSLHRDEIAGTRTAVPQRIECSDPGAQQRSSFRRIESIGNARYSLDWRDHIFLIATVEIKSSDCAFLAVRKIAGAAGRAGIVLSAMPANANAISLFPGGHTRTDLINYAGDFVTRHARKLETRPESVFQ